MNKNKAASKRSIAVVVTALSCLLAFTAFEIPGCQPQHKKPEGAVIARVGHAYLTLEELQASIPPEYSSAITRDQNIQYVRQWVNTELLYQEALRQRIDHEPDTKARLEKMKKDLLSSEVISRSAMSGGASIDEESVREYYEANREQFVRESNVVRYETILVDDINLAYEIRRTATHETFKDVARTYSKVQLAENTPYAALDAIPPVLRNAIVAAATPSITGPYRSEEGFYVLRVVSKFDAGTIASLDEVRDEIVSRLSSITQQGEIEKLIAEVRSRAHVEFNIDLIPGSDVPENSAADVEVDTDVDTAGQN
jgi:hypothetical protein